MGSTNLPPRRDLTVWLRQKRWVALAIVLQCALAVGVVLLMGYLFPAH
jgi:uncharacterized protein involved in exopolysaccharide biosynthesis